MILKRNSMSGMWRTGRMYTFPRICEGVQVRGSERTAINLIHKLIGYSLTFSAAPRAWVLDTYQLELL